MWTSLGRSFSTANSKQDYLEALARQLMKGERLSLSRAITLNESTLPSHQASITTLLNHLQAIKSPRKPALRLGFTGAPGVGKSTFIEAFGNYLVTCCKKQLAVLTVDPSSVRSGGSLLGDKIRMPTLATHPAAYIRSSPTGGTTGGEPYENVDAGFDVILIETVGVGQSEWAVRELVDMLILLVAPGVGDELQGLKKGITEVVDLILVNKADNPLDQAANHTLLDYRNAIKMSSSLMALSQPDQPPLQASFRPWFHSISSHLP